MKSMTIEFRSRFFRMTEGLRRQGTQVLVSALAPFQDRIQSIQVRFSDENGPKKGVDQVCSVQVQVEGLAPVHVEARAENVHQALLAAARKVRVAVERSSQRTRRFAPVPVPIV